MSIFFNKIHIFGNFFVRFVDDVFAIGREGVLDLLGHEKVTAKDHSQWRPEYFVDAVIKMGEFFVLFHGKLQLTYSVSDSYLKHDILCLPLGQPVIQLHDLIAHSLTVVIDHVDGLDKVSRRGVETSCAQQVTDTEMCLFVFLKSLFQYAGDLIVPCGGDFSDD